MVKNGLQKIKISLSRETLQAENSNLIPHTLAWDAVKKV